ncbi:MAG: eCIS core domain-containing protein [Chloroflexota bacterium]
MTGYRSPARLARRATRDRAQEAPSSLVGSWGGAQPSSIVGNQAVQRLAQHGRLPATMLAGLGNQAIQRVAAASPPRSAGGSPARAPLATAPRDSNSPNQTGLPTGVLGKMESFFGQDFSDVRVHADSPRADQVGALAFAQGNQVHVAPGQWQPHTETGQWMVGHELAHVVQQGQGKVRPTTRAGGVAANDDPGLEREADQLGHRAAGSAFPGGPAVGQATLDRGTRAEGGVTASYAGPAPIQRIRKNHDELLELTVAEFDRHRKAEQMDWANEDFDVQARGIIWQVVEWGLDGLGSIKLGDVVTDARADASSLTYLKNYCEALNGELEGQPTVQLEKLGTLNEILIEGRWVGTLNGALTGPLVKAIMPRAAFKALIANPDVATAFVTYYQTCSPIFEAPNGKDTLAFITLVKDEGGKISDYKGALTDIRNYHKFMKASLDKLKTDKGKKDKPLTLVLQSLYDHNGAFVRHEHVNKVIQNTNTRAYAMEGLNVQQLMGLTKVGFQKLATEHGMGGTITQVMFAGHGSSTSIQLGGKETDVSKNPDTGEYKVKEKGGVPVSFAKTSTGKTTMRDFWTAFFEALFKKMAMQGGLQPTILLRACLTASNAVDTTKLKKELKESGTIDVDDKSVDPTTEENQEKIRKGIVEYIKENGSLATVIGNQAKGRAQVLGAQASITNKTAGSINEATGQLEIVALTDPQVAGPKIEYVREGKEPLGAIKAVIESWAHDRDGCFAKMQERLLDPVNTDDEFIIQLLYRTIINVYPNNILKANGFTGTAHALHSIAAGGADCRPVALMKDSMTQAHRAAFYPALLGRFANKFAKLAIYQDWLRTDVVRRVDFVNLLGDAAFERDTVQNYLNFEMINPDVKSILALGGTSLRGRIILSLVGFIEKKRDDCKGFLTSQVDGNQVFTNDVKTALRGYSEDKLRQELGLPVGAASTVATEGGESGPQKNIAASGQFHVEPVRSAVRPMTRAELLDWAKVRTAPNDSAIVLEERYRTKDYTVVGEVKTLSGGDAGWYMIRLESGKVAYIRKKYF